MDRRTIGDRILSLSATISMPPYMWRHVEPICRTCANLYGDLEGHRWPRWSREELRMKGARQMRFAGGSVSLVLPLTLFWRLDPAAPSESRVRVPPYCFLHEVRAEWDAAERSVEAFGVQDLHRFSVDLERLDEVSFSRRR